MQNSITNQPTTADKVRILVACEYSGIVSGAFSAKGLNVTSCDFLSADHNGKHYKGDVLDILYKGWDLLIGFPPCTFLCNAQLYRCVPGSYEREKMIEALAFFKILLDAPIKYIALENPRGVIPRYFGSWSQSVQPWYFGDPYTKHVNLWLKNLPPLISSVYSPGRKHMKNHTNSRMTQEQKSKIHSKFYPGIARAMADQWCKYLLQ